MNKYLKKIIFISLLITLFMEISFAKTGKIVSGDGKCLSTDIYNQGRVEKCNKINQKQLWEITDDLRLRNIDTNRYLTLIKLKSNSWRISLRKKDQQLQNNEKIQSQYFKINKKKKLISNDFTNFCITSNRTYLGVRGISSCSYKSYWQDFDTPSNFTFLEEINGYILPPEPDETLNNSTLLGIDSNNNGVRDDVEIYVIKRYAKDPKYPKTKTAIALQYAWASQKILESPTMESKKHIDDAIDCQYYWFDTKTKNLSGFEMGKYFSKHKVTNNPEIKDEIYNTRKRINQKFLFNAALSGNIFNGTKQDIDNCQINIDELGE